MWLVLMVRLTSVPFSEKNRSIFMLARNYEEGVISGVVSGVNTSVA